MTVASTLIILIVALIISVGLAPFAIPMLTRLKFGQSIREEGPQSHMKKAGTPTMGGVIFTISILVTTLLLGVIYGFFTVQTTILLLVFIGFAIIGFLDDGLKVIFKRNLGLTSLQKLLGQIGIAIVAYLLLLLSDSFEPTLSLFGLTVDVGIFYIAFLIFWLVGFSNAVNLTDGLDGLAAGTSSIAFAAFGIIAALQEQADVALFAFAVTGALLGFLLFNAKPAKVFMGDTGSLALGGALAMLSVLTKTEFLLLLIGLVFVVETLSVIIQVSYYKKTKKRIFRMSPIHHHFEEGGWSEWKVVLVFWAVGLVVAIIGVLVEAL
ncbi:MAG: phospho-N-acetylmuramoyl-pentapeptide-transferase [Caryophanon sp.]|nr:phospho-N-acetylmuramoyl-pentapeptide-transferase [Caryophanon sp.]